MLFTPRTPPHLVFERVTDFHQFYMPRTFQCAIINNNIIYARTSEVKS